MIALFVDMEGKRRMWISRYWPYPIDDKGKRGDIGSHVNNKSEASPNKSKKSHTAVIIEIFTAAPVAQWIEQWIPNPCAASSILAGGTNKNKGLHYFHPDQHSNKTIVNQI